MHGHIYVGTNGAFSLGLFAKGAHISPPTFKEN